MSGELAGAAQGAAIGTSIMPGWGTAIGAVAGALMGGSSVAQPGSSGGGPFAMPTSGAASSPQATPQSAQAAAFGSGLDGSGWAINFGSGSIDLNNAQDKTIRSTGPVADAKATGTAESTADAKAGAVNPYGQTYSTVDTLGGVASGFASVPPLVWYVVIGAIAWRLYKSGK
jgi:hypothetical protein